LNLVLLEPADLAPDGTARLTGRRALHLVSVLRAVAGDRIQAGVVGGRLGEAEVLRVSDEEVVLAPKLDRDPPLPSPIALIAAVPRPKILRRVLQTVASMGVKRLVLIGSYRVEKSYFHSPFLAPQAIRAELLLGLEQGRDTLVPEVLVRPLFKPFIEDELDVVLASPTRLLAHPHGAAPLESLAPKTASGDAVLAVGPEGGWTAYEADRLRGCGFAPFTLGARVLRVDAAVPYAVGQVELWLRGHAAAPGADGGRDEAGGRTGPPASSTTTTSA
jgi:RsmE family RNA methyltransferase